MGEKEEKPDDQEKKDGDGQEKKNQPQKERYVWSDERHGMFLKALQELEEEGRDIVPKNIKEKMKLQGEKIKRAQVSSHLQKYRENLAKQKKREEEEALAREEDIGWEDAAGAGAPEGPSPSSSRPLPQAHPPPLPPAAAADAPALDVPQPLQTGQLVVQQPPGTPPFCLGSSGDIVVATALLLQQKPQLEAVAVPIAEQARGLSALPPLQPDAAAARRRLVIWEQPARSSQQNQAVAAAGSGAYAPPTLVNHSVDRMSIQLGMMRAHFAAASLGAHGHRTPPEPHVQACPVAPAIGGECSAAEANMRYEEAEIRKAQQLRAAMAGEGEGEERAAEAEPDEAVAGSPSPRDNLVARFWESDDPEPSWDFLGMPQTRSF